MSDNKKYYYLKLRDNYFENGNIQALESRENGDLYSLILLKLYLIAIHFDGALMMTETIPYDPTQISYLAKRIRHDIDHVKETIRLGVKLDLLTIIDTGQIWMNDIQNFIGRSSTEADRIRDYRKKLKQIDQVGSKSVQMYDKCTPEIEIEIEKEIEIEIEKEKEKDEPPPLSVDAAEYLYNRIMDNVAPTRYKNKKPDVKSWAIEIDYLNRIDGIDYGIIKDTIDFATNDNFWSNNILSGKSLRRNYDKLELAIKKNRSKPISDEQKYWIPLEPTVNQ